MTGKQLIENMINNSIQIEEEEYGRICRTLRRKTY